MESWEALPDAPLGRVGSVSAGFLRRGCSTYREAARYVHALPYGRTRPRDDFRAVLSEGRGTCSTKHALLAELAAEQGLDVRLTLGIYAMSERNTPGVGAVLEASGLSRIPEAHCYLRFGDARVDVTRSGVDPAPDVVEPCAEQTIDPPQIGDYKVAYHREHMREWLERQSPRPALGVEELWALRERCIAALTQDPD